MDCYAARFLDMAVKSFPRLGRFLDYFLLHGEHYSSKREERRRFEEKNEAQANRIAELELRVADSQLDRYTAVKRMKKAEKIREEFEKRAEQIMNQYSTHRIIELEGLVEHEKHRVAELRKVSDDKMIKWLKKGLGEIGFGFVLTKPDYEVQHVDSRAGELFNIPGYKDEETWNKKEWSGILYRDLVKRTKDSPVLGRKMKYVVVTCAYSSDPGAKHQIYEKEVVFRVDPDDESSRIFARGIIVGDTNVIERAVRATARAAVKLGRLSPFGSKSKKLKPAIQGGNA